MSHENGFSTHRTQGNDCNCIEPITRITSFSIPGALKAHHCSETLPGYCCLPAVSGREVERNHWQNVQNFKKKKSDSNHKPEGIQLLAQILQILRNSWYKKYTPDPKSLAGHLRADGKFWALLILLFFQRKKLKPHDSPALLTFEFILPHYCDLVVLEKINTWQS